MLLKIVESKSDSEIIFKHNFRVPAARLKKPKQIFSSLYCVIKKFTEQVLTCMFNGEKEKFLD